VKGLHPAIPVVIRRKIIVGGSPPENTGGTDEEAVIRNPRLAPALWRRMRFRIHPTVGETAEEFNPYALAGEPEVMLL